MEETKETKNIEHKEIKNKIQEFETWVRSYYVVENVKEIASVKTICRSDRSPVHSVVLHESDSRRVQEFELNTWVLVIEPIIPLINNSLSEIVHLVAIGKVIKLSTRPTVRKRRYLIQFILGVNPWIGLRDIPASMLLKLEKRTILPSTLTSTPYWLTEQIKLHIK
jgi:hypothetical protein